MMMMVTVTAVMTVKMLTINHMSLGELNESCSFFYLHFCIFPFIESHM